MRTDLTSLKNFLERELTLKKKLRPSYSRRAFARDLGISATALTEFLEGKRELSFRNIDQVFAYLGKRVHCSWCDQAHRKTTFMIEGPRKQFICDACIAKCLEIAQEGGFAVPNRSA